MLYKKTFLLLPAVLVIAFAVQACTAPQVVRKTTPPDSRYARFVQTPQMIFKIHYKNGDLFVYDTLYTLTEKKDFYYGYGRRLDLNRQVTAKGKLAAYTDSILLIETNQIMDDGPYTSLMFMTGISVAATIYCWSNPKACFGSCPTFYYDEGGTEHLIAESFSQSILPSLEREDIDAFRGIRPKTRDIRLVMKNESLETHAVKYARILAVPKEGKHIYSTPDGRFLKTEGESLLSGMIHGEECTDLFRYHDQQEYISLTDSADLAVKEELIFTFQRNGMKSPGLVVTHRQSLLTTFLLYQTLAYMGNETGSWLTRLDGMTRSSDPVFKQLGSMIGEMEFFAEDGNGNWIPAGMLDETGPIAQEVKILPLPAAASGDEIRIKVRMTKGFWKLDQLKLADITGEAEPVVISPQLVKNDRKELDITDSFNNPGSYTVTLPGEYISLYFRLPEDFTDYDYFLAAKGYYLEWIRSEWIQEENAAKVMQLIMRPEQYFKDLAPLYKAMEADMEETFRRSKYAAQ
ncbi:MAG: hypothetical protein HRU80_01390 [Ignavibacteriales bacterium]|nr:MAG: hypothetical protein HRU80_01390 [Ignavibacteriales bacterium]